jgi:hypothetical protein
MIFLLKSKYSFRPKTTDKERGLFIMKKRLGVLLAVVTAAVIVAVPARVPAADIDLPVHTQQYENVSFYSGGVGIEERQQLPQLYLLKVVFRSDRGHLLPDADVTMRAGGKIVFRCRAENGPWLFVDLPPGAYDIEAVLNGKARSAKGVRLAAGKLRIVVLTWKTTEVDMGLKISE